MPEASTAVEEMMPLMKAMTPAMTVRSANLVNSASVKENAVASMKSAKTIIIPGPDKAPCTVPKMVPRNRQKKSNAFARL